MKRPHASTDTASFSADQITAGWDCLDAIRLIPFLLGPALQMSHCGVRERAKMGTCFNLGSANE
jgi:hypothetical protein